MDHLNNLELIDVREFSTKSLAGELDDFSLLADMGFPEKDLLAKQMHVYRAESGADIFSEGEQGVFICFILDGKVELIKDTEDGKHKRLAKLVSQRLRQTTGMLVDHLEG